MIIGVPKEIKEQENRVGAVPAMVHDLVTAGHRVLVQAGAGSGAGILDDQFAQAGAEIVADAAAVYGAAELVVKVKEPLPQEYPLLRPGQMLFTYFHFAASRGLTEAMCASGVHCFAYETLTVAGHLPLLTPMSEVAGRMSVQIGAFFLEAHKGGRGILLGGVPGVEPARVLVLGGGHVGANAARIAAGLGADVLVMDVDLQRLRWLSDIMPANVRTLASSPYALREQLPSADLVIGAVLVSGARAPMLIRREDLKLMRDDGPVIVDVAIDQGGCVETSRPTTHAEPTFVVDGVVHYCVANMPGAVPRTATFALTNATGPYVRLLADLGMAAAAAHPVLRTAANVLAGQVTHAAVAEAFGLEFRAPGDVIL
ncbi:alanine dehydrogenase [Thiohalocapsa marina]|uniref:Alanine dehydrogenase n=1 Tax=Thiohalocapsa marina TaxID=424902 RepID=A0A5M8FGL7_9GAMM|nr:alanine dehydrogenase [Thiohalocapsa marina]KAA6184008.1 alanine dehydrogenase [Thiohalocapsa marina]